MKKKNTGLIQMLAGEAYFKDYQIFFNAGAPGELLFIPNAPLLITAGVGMFDNEVIVTLPIESAGQSGKGVGNSDYFGIQSTQHIGSFDLRAYFERYKGFYIDSKEIVKPDESYYFFPDMSSRHYGGEIAYYTTYHTIQELDSLIASMTEPSITKFGLKFGITYDKTTLDAIPQNGSFPGSAQLPFSRAESETLAPRLGLLCSIIGDMSKNPRMTMNGYLLMTMLFSAGYGNTQFISTDNGVVQQERLNTETFELLFDVGLRVPASHALVGMKIYYEGITVEKKNLEYSSGMFGVYGKIVY